MIKLFDLIKINIPDYLGLFEINKKTGINNKIAAILKTILLFILYLIIGYFIYRLANRAIVSFNTINLPHLIIGEFFTIGSLFIFFFNIYKSDIYNVLEYEILISMPIKKETIVLSKIIIMYINSLILASLFMIPTLLVYSNYATFDASLTLRLILGTIIMPIFPNVLAVFINSIITIISSKFKCQKLIQTMLLFILTIALTYISLKVIDISSIDIFHMETSFNNFLNSTYPLNKYFLGSIIYNNMIATIIYYGLSLISTIIAIFFLTISYSRVIQKIHNNQVYIYNKSIKMDKHSKFYALFSKDFKKFITSPYYIINSIMPQLILLIFGIIMNFVNIFDKINIPITKAFLAKEIPLFFIFSILLSCTTSVSLSLESKYYYILKSIPIKNQEILLSKVLLNQFLIIPITLITLVIFNISLPISFVTNAVTILSIAVFSFFIGTYGLFINLLFPLKDWKSEAKVYNNSLSPFLTFYSAILIIIVIILNKLSNFITYILLINLIFLAISSILLFIILKFSDKFISKITY